MKNAKNNVEDQSPAPLALSWDTLPDLAKNRWEEAVAFDVTVENQLAKAKADRSTAETERQRIAREILDATKDVCTEIITNGQRALTRAKKMESEAAKNHSYSQDELEQARAIRAEAEGYRDKIMAEVDQEARLFIDQAKSTTDQECLALRTQAAQEYKRILGQVEIMKTAVKEELETQKIYTDAARIKTTSDELLSRLREITSEDRSPIEHQPGETLTSIEVIDELGGDTSGETAMTETVLSTEYEPESEKPALETPAVSASAGQNGKKPSRRTAAAK